MGYFKTFFLMFSIVCLFIFTGYALGGETGLLIALLVGIFSNVFAYWYSDKVILSISKNRVGATAVLENDNLVGIITDGDLRRMLQIKSSFVNFKAKDIMSTNPKKVDISILAYDALKIMQSNNISQLIVISDDEYKGIVHIHEIIKEGLV